MSGLLEYSGLSTKIKAMKSKMLSNEDYVALAEQNSIAGIVSYLKKTEAYKNIIINENENSIRRHRLEMLVRMSLYNDYDKIYKFSHQQQKKYLKSYFVKYAVMIIKKALRKCFGTGQKDFEIGVIDFAVFNKKSGINAAELLMADNIEEIINILDGTPYCNLLKMVYKKGDAVLFDYETVLDIYYFSQLWRTAEKVLEKKDLAVIKKNYGEQIDLLNIIWLYRSKKYYNITPARQYSFIIPIYHKIKKQDMIYLAKTGDIEEFKRALAGVSYIKKYGDIDEINPEIIFDNYLDNLFSKAVKDYPYSVACIESYFSQKEEEIEKLIHIIECVRYLTDKEKIINYIMGT